jgi:hypothetical protein
MKRDGDIALLFQKVAEKIHLRSSIPSNDAMTHDGDIGPWVHTTGDSRISGDIVHPVNLINPSRSSEDNVGSSGNTLTPSPMPSPSVYDDCLVIFNERDVFFNMKYEDIINSFMVMRSPDKNK